MMTKQQIMSSGLLRREIFNHTIHGNFDVTAMRAAAKASGVKPNKVTIDAALIKHVTEERDVDPERVRALREEEWRYDPAMCVVMKEADGSESHLLIDGAHRIMRHVMEGSTEFLMWFATPEAIIRPAPLSPFEEKQEWGTFQVDDNGKIYNDNRKKPACDTKDDEDK